MVAIGCGWALGRFQNRATRHGQVHAGKSSPTAEQIASSVLVQDIPDQALDSFLAALDVNSDTLETHLTLAAIWRKKGELERAIRIHEHLLRRSGLKPIQRDLVQYELATDYTQAGLLDRAERELQKLVEHAKGYRQPALIQLLDLYQQTGEWRKAINVANLLVDAFGTPPLREKMNRLRGHFYCEIASDALRQQDYLGVRRALGRALQYGASQTRPMVLLAQLEFALERKEEALETLSNLVDGLEETPAVLKDLLPRVHPRLKQSDSHPLYRQLLEKLFRRSTDHWVAVLLLDLIQAQEGEVAVHQFLQQAISDRPSPGLVGEAIVRSVYTAGDQRVRGAVLKLLQSRDSGKAFVCEDCGFVAHQWHWRCPGCNHWDSILSTGNQELEKEHHA